MNPFILVGAILIGIGVLQEKDKESKGTQNKESKGAQTVIPKKDNDPAGKTDGDVIKSKSSTVQ